MSDYTVAVLGAGPGGYVAAIRAAQLGAKVVSISDSNGTVHDPDGIDAEKLAFVFDLKNVRRGRIKEYANRFAVEYFEGKRPWGIKCDCAFPSATQNEISGSDAKTLLKNGCHVIVEAANMPSTPEAIEQFINNNTLYGPAKAANAGGVATSGLEMSQNSQRLSWTREEVDKRLQNIMIAIYKQCQQAAEEYGQPDNLLMGANIAAFVKVADSMLDQGLV